jgi:amino acid adenylation domain-containing protein
LREHERLPLLHHYLIETASRFGDRTAVMDGDRSITFADLMLQARRLGAALREKGLDKGDRVAFIMPKSLEAIVSIFATLLNGAIYVPLDPHWPADRIQTTLVDCSARFVILKCAEDLPARIPYLGCGKADMKSAPVIVEEGGRLLHWQDAMESRENDFTEPAISPSDPALILFTSGSTGRPKGVTIPHQAVAAFVSWACKEFEIGPADRLACPSPLSFDLSTLDIFAMALQGAACVIAPDQIAWMPRFLSQFAAEQRITIWYSVPSILTAMLFEGGLQKQPIPGLRIVAFAGEVFPSPIVQKLKAIVPGARFYNLYGPTETNVVTWYRVPDDFDFSKPIPIGEACPYAELLLDSGGTNNSETGISGDLLVSGQSVMLGYWKRPEETARVFAEIRDACGDSRHFYRTGDRVIADAATGNFIFAGRKDRQVKRRGFRIELDEIERVLGQHPKIREVAAASSQDSMQQAVITALIRFDTGESVSQIELKTHCARFLPSYMMPDRIMPVDAIPKGNRGKTDYEAIIDMLRRI